MRTVGWVDPGSGAGGRPNTDFRRNLRWVGASLDQTCMLNARMPADRRSSVDATRTYTVILEPAEEGGFVVHVSALPEVIRKG